MAKATKAPAKDPMIMDISEIMSDDGKALSMVCQDFKDAEIQRQPFENAWNEYYRGWKNKLKLPPGYPLNSRMFMPLIHPYVETMVPFMMDSLFDDRRMVFGFGREETDQAGADLSAKLLNYQMLSRMNYETELEKTFRGEMVYGTAWQKVFWLNQTQADFRKDEKGRQSVVKFNEGRWKRQQVFDDPMAKYISTYSLYPDMANHEVNDMRFMIHRYFVPFSKLKSAERAPGKDGEVWLKNLKDIASTGIPETPTFIDDHKTSQGRKSTGYPTEDFHTFENNRVDKMVEVLDWWSGSWLVRVVNRKVVIYNGPNPWPFQRIPFVKFVPTKDPESLYGMGVAEVLQSLQNAINMTVNQRQDNVNYILNRMWKVVRSAHINFDDLVSRPGGYIEVNQLSDIEPLVTQDVTQNAIAVVNDFIRFAELATGITDLFRGEEPGSSRFPATSVALLQRSSGRRFGLPVRGNRQSIVEVMGMLHELNSEYVTGERVARIVGVDGGVEFPRIDEALLRETYADFIPVGKAAGGNRDVMLRTLQEIDQSWSERPELGQNGRRELMQRIMALADVPAIGKVVPTPEPQAAGANPLAELLESVRGRLGAGGAPLSPTPSPDQVGGAPAEVVGVPPGPGAQAPGGNRELPIPGVEG